MPPAPRRSAIWYFPSITAPRRGSPSGRDIAAPDIVGPPHDGAVTRAGPIRGEGGSAERSSFRHARERRSWAPAVMAQPAATVTVRTIADLITSDLCVDAREPIAKVVRIWEGHPGTDGMGVLDGPRVRYLSRARFF